MDIVQLKILTDSSILAEKSHIEIIDIILSPTIISYRGSSFSKRSLPFRSLFSESLFSILPTLVFSNLVGLFFQFQENLRSYRLSENDS